MDIRDLKEVKNINDSTYKRVARITSDSTTESLRIFKTLAADDYVTKIILYTHDEFLKAFFIRKEHYGFMLLVFDTSDLNVALGHRIHEVGKAVRAILSESDTDLEYITNVFETPSHHSDLLSLEEYPEIINKQHTDKLSEKNVMKFFGLMSDFYKNKRPHHIDGFIEG